MTRPRSAEDLDELHLRARLRLERRRKASGCFVCALWDGSNRIVGHRGRHGILAPDLVREASALVAAIDALREDEPIPLDVPPQYDGRDGSIEISAAEEDAYIAGMDENMKAWAHGDH